MLLQNRVFKTQGYGTPCLPPPFGKKSATCNKAISAELRFITLGRRRTQFKRPLPLFLRGLFYTMFANFLYFLIPSSSSGLCNAKKCSVRHCRLHMWLFPPSFGGFARSSSRRINPSSANATAFLWSRTEQILLEKCHFFLA